MGRRVAPFDTVCQRQYAAELMAFRHKKGRPMELRDTMIAGIVRFACHATLANAEYAALWKTLSSSCEPVD